MADEVPASELELLVDAHAIVGEGPVWSVDEQALYWVDIIGDAVHRYDPATGADRAWNVGQSVGAIGLRQGHPSSLLLALRDGFGTLDLGSGKVELRTPVEAENGANRLNDGKPDPRGRFWAGTMGYNSEPELGTFYRLDPDWSVTPQFSGVSISNGLDWTVDERTMYYIDSPTQSVDAFDFDADQGRIAGRRSVFQIPRSVGLPDGMTLDGEGYLWVSLFGVGAVNRYAPDGRLDRVVHVPASQTTCCAFGGANLDELYITSAARGLSASAEPNAGGLYRYRAGVKGRPPNTFAG
ncbi:MAG: SMP-30/gluconolactonase/LRE family protein [Chloroflexi bacterium]|nr:SMP-30/gluconolactonase/LRE family protein [Chloroflexota bacterium]